MANLDGNQCMYFVSFGTIFVSLNGILYSGFS